MLEIEHTPRLMFGLEIDEISLVVGIILRLLIFGKLSIVMIFHSLTSALETRLLVRWEDLPFFTHSFGDLSEAILLPFQAFSHFCDGC